MADNLVNGDADNSVQTALLTVGMLEPNFDTSTTDVEGEDIEKAKRKSHHAEIEKRRKSKLNEGINKLIEVLPDQDTKRSKVQILEDTYNLVVELQKKCNQLMIQNAPESEVDEIKRLMEENTKLKKEKEDWTEFFKSMNINTDIRTHMKAVLQSKTKKNCKLEQPSEQLLGGGQNFIIQSPTATVMGSPNLVTMPTNQMTIPIASGNRLDGSMLQAGGNPGGMLLVTTSRTGSDPQPTLTLTNNQVSVVNNERPEAEGQSPLPKTAGQALENKSASAPSLHVEGATVSTLTCTHEASNQSTVGQVNTTTAESKNTTAVTQVISTPITTPASQNQVLLQSGGTGGVRLIQQQPVQSQSQTVLIQLPGQPGQFIPVRIAPQVNQPQQVILTSQQGVNVVGTRGSAIQPKTPVKKKQPPQLKVKNLCPLQPDSRKPNSPIASQSSVQPIAPNTVTVRLPVNPTASQTSAVVMNNQLILQQPSNTVLSGGVNMPMPVQVVPKPQVTQNIVYIQQNGQLIPVILQQNQSNVQQGIQQTGAITQSQQQQLQQQTQQPPQQQSQQQALKIQTSQNLVSQPVHSAGNQISVSVSAPVVTSSAISVSHSPPTTTSQAHAFDGTSIPASSSSQVVSTSYQGNDLMTPLAIETSATQSEQGRLQGDSGFAANDILAKATESIFSSQSETSPMQLGELHDSQGHAASQSVIKNTNGLFSHQTTQPGIEIYDLPDDMDTTSSKGKHKKKKKKKSKSKEKEKKKKDKDKEKSKKIDYPLPTVASSDNNADVGDAQEMNADALLESLMQETLNTGGMDDSGGAESVMKLPVSTSLQTDIPVSSSGSVQMSSFSTDALLNSVTRENLTGSQRDTMQVSSAAISSSEASGQTIFSTFNPLNFGADILSNSMSVSGLPTYIDDEDEIVSGTNSSEGPSGITTTATEDTPTSLSVVTSSNCSQNQPSNSLSLAFCQSTDRVIPFEQRTPDSSKMATTPTSDGFHNFMSPTSFPSISSLLEQTTNAEREASISSLPPSSQKDDSPTNGFTGTSGGAFQHSWISHHSKASELARGIQPAKSQSPVSMPTVMSTTSTTLATTASIATSASMAASTSPSVNISPSSASLQASNTGNSSKSSPPLNLLSQPWLSASTADNLHDATSQSDLGNTNLRQQQQLADLLQGLSGPKVSASSQSNTEVLSSSADVLSSLPKSHSSLESLFGLAPFNETRSASQSTSNGDLFQSISSIIDSNKTRTTPNSRDNFLGLPPYSVQTPSSSSVPAMEQNSVFRESPLSQTKETASNSSAKPNNAPPSYSIINRVTAVVDKYKERKAPTASQNVPKVPDTNDVESNSNEQIFQNGTQQQSRPFAAVGPVSSSNQSRHLHPKSRALASAAVEESPPATQADTNIFAAQTSSQPIQARQRNNNQKNTNHKKSQLPVKTFSSATLHRTLTADISEEGGSGKDQMDETGVQGQPEPAQETPQQLPFRPVQEPQQHLQQASAQVAPPELPPPQPPPKSKSKGSKKRPKEKQIEPTKPPEEDMDSVGRRELDKALVNRFPWLAEGNGKPGEKQAGTVSPSTSNTNPSAFSVQSISQSSSKKSQARPRGGSSRAEPSQNPPPYPSRTPALSGDSHNQSLWNPSSFDSNVPVSSSSSMISPKQTSQDRSQRHHHHHHHHQGSAELSHQSNPDSMDTPLQSRQSSGNSRPPYQTSSLSPNYVQAAVNAAVNKATQQALHAKSMAGSTSVLEKSRSALTTKKTSHRPKGGGSTQILRQTDIDDGLDFLNSTSNSSTFSTSLSSVGMDMFENTSVSSSLMTRQSDQPMQRSSSRSRTTDKQSRVDSSNLLQSDFSQDNFSFSQWNLEPPQTEDRENTRGNSHKIQELSSPNMQHMQPRGDSNCVNVNFGDTSNLGTGDDLDFSSLSSFPSSNQQQQQQQHTPSDRQTPQNQTYSVPSGRSSVASMEPSPLQSSPMNYSVQDGSHMSQINEMPHSNSSSRGPPSVETPQQQQQRRMTQSPMVQSGHPGQGIKRAATDGHHLNVAKKAHSGMHPNRRGTQQSTTESRQHSSIHSNQQSQVHSNVMQFQASTAQTLNQSSEGIFAGGEVQRTMYPSQGSSGRIQESSRSKKRAPNPSDSIFARDPHEIDGTRPAISLLQDNWFGGSTRMNTSSSNDAAPTFLPNFSNSQTSQSQSESVPSSSSSSTSSLISNISPSRRLRHSEMPTYIPSHLPGPILPSPPQTKGSHSREADITPSFNPMFTPSRTAGIHSMAANFPVFHEHQPPGSFNITKTNQLPVTQPFNFNNIFNDSPQMASTSHVSDAPTLNHSIGLTPAVHLHGNASLPAEDSVLHSNMGQRHAGQPFGLLGQNRPPDVRAQFKMGVPAPMGMPHQFHSPSFMPPY